MKNKGKPVYIYGKHPVMEALVHRPQIIQKVFVEETLRDKGFEDALSKAGIRPSELRQGNKSPIGKKPKGHQGVIARVSPEKLMLSYKEFINSINLTTDTALVLLGEVQDPHNVGAVIRSSAAFGISGVLIPEHNQAPVTGAVVKVSAGMAFKIPLVAVGNVNTTIRDLKERGFHVYGLEGKGEQSILEEKFEKPSVIIIGNEASGIREKTRELCDQLLRIPIHPSCESINAAAATSVALYAWSTQHPGALLDKQTQ